MENERKNIEEMDKVDKLKVIFELQNMLDEDIKEKRGLSEITKEVWIQRKILAMLSELSELLDEVNFKWWKNPKEVNERLVKEELVDIMHFFVSMCLTYEMTADELFSMYIEKNHENFDRQYGVSEKKGYSIKEKE